METELLDAAFQIMNSRDFRIDPLHAYVEPRKARVHELKRQFPDVEPEVVEDAYRRAEHLLEVAAELADLNRGPKNDFKGPPFDRVVLAHRCPGFSGTSYQAALGEGFMLTR